MKKWVYMIEMVFLCMSTYAQEGVKFEALSYAEALKKAGNTQKLVFLDAYTGWCGACREMDKKVFPQAKAGAFFNKHFVCVKYNMDEGEGPKLRKLFDLTAYPTYLLIRPDGTVQHRIVGGSEIDEFIAKVEKGMYPLTSLEHLAFRYTQKDMTKMEMLQYVIALAEANQYGPADTIAAELFLRLSDSERLEKQYWPIYEVTGIETIDRPKYDFFLRHKNEIAKEVGEERVNARITRLYSSYLYRHLTHYINRTEPELDMSTIHLIRQQLPLLHLPEEKMITASCQVVEAKYSRNIDTLVQVLQERIQDLPTYSLWGLATSLGSVEKTNTKASFRKMATLKELFLQYLDAEARENVADSFDNYARRGATGIYWSKISLEEACKRASRYRQNVFLCGYTSSCIAYRTMEQTILNQEEVGDFFNKHFICIQYNMETPEGRKVREKYNIDRFPAFLMIRTDGSMLGRIVGEVGKEALLEKVKENLRRAE